MRFFDPTNTYAERNCIQNHKKDLLALGTRAFVITGHSSSKKNGSLDDVIAVLEEASVPYKVFNEIEENPSVETVVKAAEICFKFFADFCSFYDSFNGWIFLDFIKNFIRNGGLF